MENRPASWIKSTLTRRTTEDASLQRCHQAPPALRSYGPQYRISPGLPEQFVSLQFSKAEPVRLATTGSAPSTTWHT